MVMLLEPGDPQTSAEMTEVSGWSSALSRRSGIEIVHSRSICRVGSPWRDFVRLATEPLKRAHQSLQPFGGTVETLTRVEVFDLDDTGFPLTYFVNRMYA
jgi:hypothetical protein